MNDSNELLPFEGGGSFPVQYELHWEGHDYYIRYRWGLLTITRDPWTDAETVLLEQRLADESTSDGMWSDRETNVFLHLVSRAICDQAFPPDLIPPAAEVRRHPQFRLGPLPRYERITCDEEHPHTPDCPRKDIPACSLADALTPDELVRHARWQDRSDGKKR